MDTDRVLSGRYEVGVVIGRGGMADVHRGRDLHRHRPVAIKVLRENLARDPRSRARFRREAKTVAGLDHPSIVAVYDTGEFDDDSGEEGHVPYIVMEHVAGRTLRELLDRDGLTIERSIRYQLGVLSALACSHRAGVVHRDIKPSNVMVRPDGSIKVVDFGIARSLADPAAAMTRTGTVLGTARYIAPEQVRGGTVDGRSDLYSAGCLLYELLTGRPPFVGECSISVAYQHVHERPARVSAHRRDLVPAFDPVLARALAKDPHDRFQTADAFSDALRSAAKSLRLEDGVAGCGTREPTRLERIR
jgi:serine/threonine protein kinase